MKWLSHLFVGFASLCGIGCPKTPPEFPQLEKNILDVSFVERQTMARVSMSEVQPDKQYKVLLTGSQPGVAVVLGHSSGGGLSVVSDIVSISKNQNTVVSADQDEYLFHTHNLQEFIAPGGPIYIVFASEREDMELLIEYLKNGGDWQQVKPFAVVVKRAIGKK
jgi:hypothetical protein